MMCSWFLLLHVTVCLCVHVCVRVPRGLKPSEAELCFLNTARTLELYGVELHVAMVVLLID